MILASEVSDSVDAIIIYQSLILSHLLLPLLIERPTAGNRFEPPSHNCARFALARLTDDIGKYRQTQPRQVFCNGAVPTKA
jgi:hypothetical protein